MKYSKVQITSLGYELAPVVVTSAELESRLEPLYKALRFAPGQLQALTGIRERRFAEDSQSTSDLATIAAIRALANGGLDPAELDCIIVGPATLPCTHAFFPYSRAAVVARSFSRSNRSPDFGRSSIF